MRTILVQGVLRCKKIAIGTLANSMCNQLDLASTNVVKPTSRLLTRGWLQAPTPSGVPERERRGGINGCHACEAR